MSTGIIVVAGMALESVQHFCNRVSLVPNSIRGLIQSREVATVPYYQQRKKGPLYIEMRCADIIIEAANAAQASGLPRPVKPWLRPRGRQNDKEYMEFVRGYLEKHEDLWTPEQRRLKPPMTRRPHSGHMEAFHAPLPWPEEMSIEPQPPLFDLPTDIDADLKTVNLSARSIKALTEAIVQALDTRIAGEVHAAVIEAFTRAASRVREVNGRTPDEPPTRN